MNYFKKPLDGGFLFKNDAKSKKITFLFIVFSFYISRTWTSLGLEMQSGRGELQSSPTSMPTNLKFHQQQSNQPDNKPPKQQTTQTTDQPNNKPTKQQTNQQTNQPNIS